MENIIVYGTYHNRLIDGEMYSALNGNFDAGFTKLPFDEYLNSNGVKFYDELFNANYHTVCDFVNEAVANGNNSIIVSMRWELSADRTEVLNVVVHSVNYGVATDLQNSEVATSLDGIVELAEGVHADSLAAGLPSDYIAVAMYMVGYLQGKRAPGETLAPYGTRIMNEARRIAGIEYRGETSLNEALAKLDKYIFATA